MHHLKAILMLLKDGGLTLKLRKCFFLWYRAEYMRYIELPGFLHVFLKTWNHIKAMQPDTNVVQLRSFIGLYIV